MWLSAASEPRGRERESALQVWGPEQAEGASDPSPWSSSGDGTDQVRGNLPWGICSWEGVWSPSCQAERLGATGCRDPGQ